jgi:secreted PhoX family phosphatase
MQLKKMGVSVNKIRMKEDAWKANGKYNRRNNTITSLTKRTIVDKLDTCHEKEGETVAAGQDIIKAGRVTKANI